MRLDVVSCTVAKVVVGNHKSFKPRLHELTTRREKVLGLRWHFSYGIDIRNKIKYVNTHIGFDTV
jgi:hypothetical protein